MPQTTIQHSETIRFGSGKFELGASIGSLVNIGAIRNAKFTQTFDRVEVKSDNAGVVYTGISNHECELACDLMEINVDTLDSFLYGAGSVTTTAGTPQTITDETITLTLLLGQTLAYKNADNTPVSITSIRSAASGGGTLYDKAVHATGGDYGVSTSADGKTVIVRSDAASSITSGQTVYVTYQYTPSANKVWKVGGPQQLTARVARFTNTNASSKVFHITVYKATASEGIAIDFVADDADDVAVTPIVLKGVIDTSRSSGDQLFAIYDEQHGT